ncbi:hypothetical protein Tco_1017262 [Tanacetum coccineum]|uniref:Uncharacterized protein n=1 Tax=Tanacetum coccineum TaxID=301880 RepID=A0ABQ5FTK2_9ASTR
MSPGNMCNGGTNYLTEKYVGPTVLLRIVAGERIPSERSQRTFPSDKSPGKDIPTWPSTKRLCDQGPMSKNRLLHRTSIQRYMDHRPSFEDIRESLIAISYCMPERFSCLTGEGNGVAVATETRVETGVDKMRSKLISVAASW